MENDAVEEQTHKKGRHRKKHLYNSILQQMEFYFSDSNLSKDRFMSQLLEENSYIDLSVFLQFNKIRKLTSSIEDIQKALSKSEIIEVSEDKTKVYRKAPLKIRTNVDDCTMYVENIKSDTTHEWLSTAFSQFGKVVYVSIPKYKHNKMNKGFAFIEFEQESSITEAINYFESIGNKISLQIPPEELCSIATFETDQNVETNEGEHEEETEIKKRKRSMDSVEENEEKKTKKEDKSDTEDKKKSKKSKKKCQFKEMGLQVLTKREWKKLRNKYLNMQKEKMKQLKQHLYRARLGKQNYEQNSSPAQENMGDGDNKTPKLEFLPNVIVKLKLPEPCFEIKKIKNDLKTISNNIKYIDMNINSDTVHLRFADEGNAKEFCNKGYDGCESVLLVGEEEKQYWEKIQNDRSVKFTKEKGQRKQRGRDKLLKKAEKTLQKHIVFDDAD